MNNYLPVYQWTNSVCLNVFHIITCLSLVSISIGEPLKIRPKLCTNAMGEEGTCMFVWECIKTEGKHLGTCVDGFLFGSCCAHNDTYNSINHIDQDPSSSMTTAVYDLTPTTTKEKHKNKWKPTFPGHSHRPSIIPSSTPVPIMSTSIKPTTSNTAASVVSKKPTISVFTSSYKPVTTPKPWSIYTVNSLNHGSTYRPAIVSILASSNSPNQFPHFTKLPVKTPTTTSKPTIINKTPAQQVTSSLVVQASHATTLPSTSTQATPSTTYQSTVSSVNVTTSSKSPTFSWTTTAQSSSSEQDHDITKKPLKAKSQCGVTQLRPKTKVVGGKNSAFGAWPWQVSVRRTSFFGFSSTHRCGGAILNNEWIATAGHCVDDLLLTQIRIRLGEYDFSSAMEPLPHIERGAKKKVVHPKYNFFTYENDLALVQLDEPIEFQPHVAPICLPPDEINLLGKNATVTGWGRLSEGGVLPTVLQEVRVPIMSNDKCKNMFLSAGRHEYIPEIFMCAGYDEGGRDSCQGDSGGPLQVQGDDGKWFLAGIISWGIGCGEPSLPGVCTRITKFKQWIMSYIGNE